MNIVTLVDVLKKRFPDINWSATDNAFNGVLTSFEAFRIAKDNKKKVETTSSQLYPSSDPTQIAQQITNEIRQFSFETNIQINVHAVDCFVNIYPSNEFWNNELSRLQYEREISILNRENEKVLVDYFQLNAAKKAHLGHIRSGNIGEAIRRIMKLKYLIVITDRHIGDWGIQFGMVIWGLQNLDKINQTTVNLFDDSIPFNKILEDIEKIYVAVNRYIEENPDTRKEIQRNALQLEDSFHDDENEYLKLWNRIVEISISEMNSEMSYLRLNKSGKWDVIDPLNQWEENVQTVLDGKKGVWELNRSHNDGKFDLDLGESFLMGYFKNEVYKWVDAGIATSNTEHGITSVFIDLEDENLGRAYLVSSDGYTTYIFRDVVARFLWAGLFSVRHALTFTDNRQSHTLKQTFAIVKRLIASQLYTKRTFPLMNNDQTLQAVENLANKMPEHIPFGFIQLPSGKMSSRKGNVITVENLKSLLESSIESTLKTKGLSEITPEKIETLGIAVLKWTDLSKDREQDVVFDLEKITQFEGNTGIYQLYTVTRLNSIIKKSGLNIQEIDDLPHSYDLLNELERMLLNKAFQVPFTIEEVIKTKKPHILCNHLYDLSTAINKWYSQYSVTHEEDSIRKNTLFKMIIKLRNHLDFHLSLLGIECVDSM